MRVKTSFSNEPDATRAVAALTENFKGCDPRLVLYFASSHYEPQRLAPLMAKAFPGAVVLGCTTAGEIVTGKMLDRSIVAMAFGDELIRRAFVTVAKDVSRDARSGVKAAIARLGSALGQDIGSLSASNHFGIVLTDGLSGAEERVMDAIGDAVNLPFVGGSAGDDLQFKKTHVFAGAEACSGNTGSGSSTGG